MQFSVDWYDIDLAGAIGQLGVQRIVNECNVDPANNLCQYVFRDPATRAVTAVRNPWLNINNARVRGLDYELLWNRDLDLLSRQDERCRCGSWPAGCSRTARRRRRSAVDLAGQLAEPENRAPVERAVSVRRFRRRSGSSGTSVSRRSTSGTITFVQFQPGLVPTGTQLTLDDATIDAKSYSDLSFTYSREMSSGQSWELSLSLTNAFDEDPPVIPSFDQRFSSQATRRTRTTCTAGAGCWVSATSCSVS